jgi:uncharacterized membrane protein YfcA
MVVFCGLKDHRLVFFSLTFSQILQFMRRSPVASCLGAACRGAISVVKDMLPQLNAIQWAMGSLAAMQYIPSRHFGPVIGWTILCLVAWHFWRRHQANREARNSQKADEYGAASEEARPNVHLVSYSYGTLAGAIGRKLLHLIPQIWFERVLLISAALAAVKLILS